MLRYMMLRKLILEETIPTRISMSGFSSAFCNRFLSGFSTKALATAIIHRKLSLCENIEMTAIRKKMAVVLLVFYFYFLFQSIGVKNCIVLFGATVVASLSCSSIDCILPQINKTHNYQPFQYGICKNASEH